MDISVKIREYKAANPELSRLSDIDVAKRMVAEGLLSQKELENLPQIMANSANLGVGDNFVPAQKTVPNVTQNKPKTHPQVPEIILDERGKIDLSQFDIASVQKKYPSDKYLVRQTDYGIVVEEKDKNIPVLTINKFKENNGRETISVSKPARLSKDDYSPGYNYSVCVEQFRYPYVLSYSNITKDGTVAKKFDDAGLTYVTETDANGRVKNHTRYLSNPPTEMIQNGNMKFISEMKDAMSLQSDDLNWKMEIFSEYAPLTDITKGNNFLKQYREKTNSDYYDDLKKFLGQQYTNIQFVAMANQRYVLAKQVKDAEINYKGYKMPDFVEYNRQVINDFDNEIIMLLKKKIAANETSDTLSLVLDNKGSIDDLLRKYPNLINDVANSSMPEDTKKNILRAVIEPFSSIDRKDDVAQIIFNSNLEPLLKDDNSDLLAKIKSAKTPEERSNLFIDLVRHSSKKSRQNLSFGQNTISKPNLAVNGKIDLPFKQGGVGDCWLLAGVMALKDKPNGNEYLNSLLTYDEKTGNVTVNLKGVGKTYTVTKDEINSATELAENEGDLRAIEIAIDKYVAELAKDGKEKAIDINGNKMEFVFKMLVGNGHVDIQGDQFFNDDKKTIDEPERNYDAVIPDFNNPKKAYTFSFKKPNPLRKDIEEFYDKKVEEVGTNERPELYSNHAYAVVKSDNQFVYFRNPHDSSKLYKIDIKFFKKFKAEVHSADLEF